jgi:hypothetical protein
MPHRNNSSSTQGWIALLGIFAGLGAFFALIVTVIDKWREHAQERWPQVITDIQRCSVDPYVPRRGRSPIWHIRCRIAYRVDQRLFTAHV